MSYWIYENDLFEKFDGSTRLLSLEDFLKAMSEERMQTLETSPILQNSRKNLEECEDKDTILRVSHYSIDFVPIEILCPNVFKIEQNKFMAMMICNPKFGEKVSPNTTIMDISRKQKTAKRKLLNKLKNYEEVSEKAENELMKIVDSVPDCIILGVGTSIIVTMLSVELDRLVLRKSFPEILGNTPLPLSLSDMAQQMFELDYNPKKAPFKVPDIFTNEPSK